MTNYPWDQTFVGWVHITCAAIVAGGLMFWWLALRPNEEAAPIGRFRLAFWASALLLLLTGGFTWTVRLSEGRPPAYFHSLYTKILLYVILFAIAGPLVKRAATGASRPSARRMLGICCILCIGILFLSAFLRRVKPPITVPGTQPLQAVVMHVGGVQP